jgi:hypothetical protein
MQNTESLDRRRRALAEKIEALPVEDQDAILDQFIAACLADELPDKAPSTALACPGNPGPAD